MSDDRKIKRRLYALAAMLGAVLLLIDAACFTGFSETGQSVDAIVSHDLPVAVSALRLKSDITQLSAILPSLFAAHDPIDAAIVGSDIEDIKFKLEATLADLRKNGSKDADGLESHIVEIRNNLKDLNADLTDRLTDEWKIASILTSGRERENNIRSLLSPTIGDAKSDLDKGLEGKSKGENRDKTVKEAAKRQAVFLALSADISWLRGLLGTAAVAQKEEEIDQAKVHFDVTADQIRHELSAAGSSEPKLGALVGDFLGYGEGPEGVFALRRAVLKHQADEWKLIWRVNRENAALQSLVKEIADRSSEEARASGEHLAHQAHVSLGIVSGGILLSLVLGLLAIVFMNRRVAIPIMQMGELMRRMERHDLAMNAMLDSLGQGLLFFDQSGICSPIYSKACLTLLETAPAEKHIGDVLRLPENKRELFMTTLALLFENKLPLGFDELSNLVPDHYAHSEGLSVSLVYRPINGADGHLRHVLVVATDRTKEREAQLLLKENQASAERVLRISHNRNYFMRFAQNFRNYFAGEHADLSNEQARRDVHTFKGAADTFHMRELAEELHGLESALTRPDIKAQSIFVARGPALLAVFERSLASARELLGEDFLAAGNVRTLPEDKIVELGHRLMNCPGDLQSVHVLFDWYLDEIVSVPVFDALKEFKSSVEELGERFGKLLHPCQIKGKNFRIVPRVYDSFLASLVHVARNIIEHGIETADARKAQGKDAHGLVTIETRTFYKNGRDWFAIEIGDDGAGINVDALRRKLAEHPGMEILAMAEDEEVLQSVLQDGVSTKGQATLLSGRGVGMSAVRAEVLRLGGSIRIFSEKGRGTRLTIELPFIRKLA